MQVVIDFIESGATVYYIARNKNLKLENIGANYLKCDLSIEKQIKKCFDLLDKIDFLINVAAINFCKKLEDINSNEWDSVLNVNLKSFYLTSRLAINKMKLNNF